MSFFQGIKLVMGHGPYAKLVMVFLFTSLAFMVRIETQTQLYCVSHQSLCPRFVFWWLISISYVIKCWVSHWYALPDTVYLAPTRCVFRQQKLTECLCFVPQLLEGNFALFCSSTLGFRNDFQNILLVIMVSGTEHKQTHRWHFQTRRQIGAVFPWQWPHLHQRIKPLAGHLCEKVTPLECRQKLPSQGERINCLQLQGCSVLG